MAHFGGSSSSSKSRNYKEKEVTHIFSSINIFNTDDTEIPTDISGQGSQDIKIMLTRRTKILIRFL